MHRLLAGLLLATTVAVVPVTHAEEVADPVKIMAMGSSTTAGSIPGGYRSDLYLMLTSEGRSVDFVGSVTDSGPAQ